MLNHPKKAPWGEILRCEMICPGVFLVETTNFGFGTMVAKDMTAILSPAAQKCGFNYEGYLCFASDIQEHVAHRELLDKRLVDFCNCGYTEDYEEIINESLQQFNPEYWQARQNELKREPVRPIEPKGNLYGFASVSVVGITVDDFNAAVEQEQARAANLKTAPDKKPIKAQMAEATAQAAKGNAARPDPAKGKAKNAER